MKLAHVLQDLQVYSREADMRFTLRYRMISWT